MRTLKVFMVVLLFIFSIANGTVCDIPADVGIVEGYISRLTDGDTVRIRAFGSRTEYKVRFLGIDAPETNYRGRSQGYYAELAKSRVGELLPLGTSVRVIYEEDKFDMYGRLLGHIYKDGININQLLLEEGLAVMYHIWPNIEYLECYSRSTEYAIDENKGMFSNENPLEELPFEFRLRIGKRNPNKWVGDFIDNIYVDPERYNEVSIANRIFFYRKKDAIDYGLIYRGYSTNIYKVLSEFIYLDFKFWE